MTMITTGHIVVDAEGVAHVEGKRTRVAQVVMDQMNGMTPEDIHRNYPHLSMAEIHAAFAYYYDNQTLIDGQISREVAWVAKMQEEARARGDQPTKAELEARVRNRRNK
jgi:uncharacterized protein (DUF433 family)